MFISEWIIGGIIAINALLLIVILKRIYNLENILFQYTSKLHASLEDSIGRIDLGRGRLEDIIEHLSKKNKDKSLLMPHNPTKLYEEYQAHKEEVSNLL